MRINQMNEMIYLFVLNVYVIDVFCSEWISGT